MDVAFTADRASAEEIAARLEAGGYEPVIVEVSDRAPDDPASGPLGYLVRVGSFARQAKADALRTELTARATRDCAPCIPARTAGDDGPVGGPRPAGRPGSLRRHAEPELATEIVPERELLTAISARTNALAAVNGGYFVIGEANGTDGDLAGSSLLAGGLVSEAVDGRTSLVLPDASGAGARITAPSDRVTVTASGGASREVDGLNRAPGSSGAAAARAATCRRSGPSTTSPARTPASSSATRRSSGPVTPSGPGRRGGPGRHRDRPRAARGARRRDPGRRGRCWPARATRRRRARWRPRRGRGRRSASCGERVSSRRGRAASAGSTGVVNGGPRARAGAATPRSPPYAEGFVCPEDPEFYYRFGERRNPRTLAGT